MPGASSWDDNAVITSHHLKSPAVAAAAVVVALLIGTVTLGGAGAAHADIKLCGYAITPVAGGTYTVQNDEFGSSAPECAGTSGNAGFTVWGSHIGTATSRLPGGYPSIYAGCHWGACTHGGLGSGSLPVAALTPGKLTTDLSVRHTDGGSYDVAYDIWTSRGSGKPSGKPDGSEIMIWLRHNGPVQPAGQVVRHVTIGGRGYTVWHQGSGQGGTTTFALDHPTDKVSNLDIGQLLQATVSWGYTGRSWYLVSVEAGFELWHGGTSLAVNNFALTISHDLLRR